MSTGRLKVPFSLWEVVALGLWSAALAVLVGTEFSRDKPVAGVLAIFFLLAAPAWDWYAHRAQPEFFAERQAPVPQAIAAAVLVAGGTAAVFLAIRPL